MLPNPLPTQESEQHVFPNRGTAMTTRVWLAPLWVLAAAIVVVTAGGLRHVYDERFAHHSGQLKAVADLRAKQVERWLQERLAHWQSARSSALLAELYRRWRVGGDIAARDELMERGAAMAKAFGGGDVLIADERGDIIAGNMASDRSTPPVLRSAVLRALASAEVQDTGLYSITSDPDQEELDFVAPLAGTGLPALAAMVLRLDPNGSLLDTLGVWPVPSRTAVTLLVRPVDDQLVGRFGRNPRSMASPNLLAARAIRGDVPFGQAVQGVDVRGNPVLGVVRPVPGTNWYLVAKIDRAEIYAEVLSDGAWIVSAGASALLCAVVWAFLLRGRRALETARFE